jgi:hypothetical protein
MPLTARSLSMKLDKRTYRRLHDKIKSYFDLNDAVMQCAGAL